MDQRFNPEVPRYLIYSEEREVGLPPQDLNGLRITRNVVVGFEYTPRTITVYERNAGVFAQADDMVTALRWLAESLHQRRRELESLDNPTKEESAQLNWLKHTISPLLQ